LENLDFLVSKTQLILLSLLGRWGGKRQLNFKIKKKEKKKKLKLNTKKGIIKIKIISLIKIL
jgi:hypothetical protein